MSRKLETLIAKRFKELSHEEKLRFISSVRQSRISPKSTSKVVQKAKKQTKKKLDKVAELLKTLPPEEVAKILGD